MPLFTGFNQVEIVDDKEKRRKEKAKDSSKEKAKDKETEIKENEIDKEVKEKEKETKEKDKVEKEKDKEKDDKEGTAINLLGSQCADSHRGETSMSSTLCCYCLLHWSYLRLYLQFCFCSPKTFGLHF